MTNIIDSIRGLAVSGAAQVGHSISYSESTAGNGWRHINIMIHAPGGLVAWYALVDPDGDDTPAGDDDMYVTLAELQERLTEYVAGNRREAA